MAATRLYFPLTEAAPVAPPSPGAEWGHNNGVTRKLLTTPDASALTTTAYTPDGADHGVNTDALHRQYVSDAIPAQTVQGNVKLQLQALEAHANNNQFVSLVVKVISNDGVTVRGTALAITRDALETTTSLVNRQFADAALGAVVAQANDRILVELGLGGTPGGGGGAQGHNGSIRWGCDASSGDLPEDDTQTGTTYRGWVEFSADLFNPSGPPEYHGDGVAALVAVGSTGTATATGPTYTADGIAALGAVGGSGTADFIPAAHADGLAPLAPIAATATAMFVPAAHADGTATLAPVGAAGTASFSEGGPVVLYVWRRTV